MPSARCKGCGRMTNSATSNFAFTKDFTPTECWMAWDEDGKKVKGCAFDKAEPWIKAWIEEQLNDKSTSDRKNKKRK